MFGIKYVSGLLLVLMGSLDCLTTVVGTQFFRTREINPFIAGLVSSNLPIFVVLKLAVTVCVALVFVFAEKTLLGNGDKGNRAFKIVHNILRVSYVGVVFFLVFVVANNVMVIYGSPM